MRCPGGSPRTAVRATQGSDASLLSLLKRPCKAALRMLGRNVKTPFHRTDGVSAHRETMPNVQIFGVKDSHSIRAAQRFFKERGVKFQFVDLKQKPMSPAEIKRFVDRLGIAIPRMQQIGFGHSSGHLKSRGDTESADGNVARGPEANPGHHSATIPEQ
jgi:hypothetical protein